MPRRQTIKKTLRLDRKQLKRAGKFLGTRTAEETVAVALDLIAARKDAVEGALRVAGSDALRDIHAADLSAPPTNRRGDGVEMQDAGDEPADMDEFLREVREGLWELAGTGIARNLFEGGRDDEEER